METLEQRSNIRTYEFEPPLGGSSVPLVLFEDHRYSLVSLWHALEQGLIKPDNPPDLIRFDRHDDAKAPKYGTECLKKIRSERPPLRHLMDFVEWELSSMDDDWVISAMELGLIRHVVTFGADVMSFPKHGHEYVDHLGVPHQAWNMGHLWHQMESLGPLRDRARTDEFQGLWDILRWDGSDIIQNRSGQTPPHPIVLDIDLDCFTGVFFENLQAWPKRILRSYLCNEAVIRFMNAQLNRSLFVNVSIESVCCGGLREAMKVLRVVDETWFSKTIFRRHL